MVPVVSAASRMIYLPSKKDGIYEYVGLDWDSGDIKARQSFPDDTPAAKSILRVATDATAKDG